MHLEIKRQIVHATGVFSVLLILIFGKFIAAILMILIAVSFLLLAEYRKSKKISRLISSEPLKGLEDVIDEEIMEYERGDEFAFDGAIMFYLGSFLVTAVFEPSIAIASIAVLALCDSISTIVGYFHGKNKLFVNKKKSWEGSSAFFIMAFLVLIFFINPVEAIIVALLVTMVEMIPGVNDNLSVPLATAVFLSLVLVL